MLRFVYSVDQKWEFEDARNGRVSVRNQIAKLAFESKVELNASSRNAIENYFSQEGVICFRNCARK
jgi:hypothetical protein